MSDDKKPTLREPDPVRRDRDSETDPLGTLVVFRIVPRRRQAPPAADADDGVLLPMVYEIAVVPGPDLSQ